jgi:hypothetical protein
MLRIDCASGASFQPFAIAAMLPPLLIFLGFVLPAVIVGIVLVWGWRWMGMAAVSVGFGLAFWKLRETPSWPPGSGDVFNWIFYFAISLGVLGIFDGLIPLPIWARAGVMAILWRFVIGKVLGRLAPQTLSYEYVGWASDLTTIIAIIWWVSLERISQIRPAALSPILLIIISAAASVLLFCWGTAEESKLAVVFVGISIAALAAMLFPKRGPLPRSVAGGIGLILLLKLSHAYFYASDPFTPAEQTFGAIFLVSPLLAFAGDLPRVKRWPVGGRAAVRILAVLLAAGIASALTLRDYLHAEQDVQQDE